MSEELREELIELLKNSLYVDDLVTGEVTETTAIELSSKSKKVMPIRIEVDSICENERRIHELHKRR